MNMNWTKDQSVKLSLVCVWIFAAVLMAVDVFAFCWIPAYIEWRGMSTGLRTPLTVTIYTASIFGWVCLYALRKLLKNIDGRRVFIDGNVKMLRLISWCCALAAADFLISAFYYIPFAIVAVAAAFMMLIVRIVKNVFERANEMKDELDLII